MANSKEVKARIKINKLLEEAGWRFFDNEKGQANIQLEPNVKITKKDIDAFGEDFESTKGGFIDFLLLDEKGFPFVVLEAKKEEKDPLDGKDDPRYQDETTKAQYLYDEGLRVLRPYQLKAIQALQRSAEAGNDRFLFEMATGTGKTLVSGAVINILESSFVR